MPDLLVVLPPTGRLLALEVKTPRTFPTPLQTATLIAIRNAGGAGYVVRSAADVKALP